MSVNRYLHSLMRRGFCFLLLITSLSLSAVAESASPSADTIRGDAHLASYIAEIKSILPAARLDVEESLGIDVPYLTIHVADNESEMRDIAKAHHHFMPPQWSAGLAYPRSKEIYLPSVPHRQLYPLIKHELVHIALGESALPLWVNEGVAVALGEGLSWERMWTLNEAASQGTLHRFKTLERRFPSSGQPASVAYAQSAHFINHLRDKFGDRALSSWLSTLRRGVDLDKASIESFSTPFWRLERSWRRSMERGVFAWLSALAKSETLWALSLILFIVFGGQKIKRRRRRFFEDEYGLEVRVAENPNILNIISYS